MKSIKKRLLIRCKLSLVGRMLILWLQRLDWTMKAMCATWTHFFPRRVQMEPHRFRAPVHCWVLIVASTLITPLYRICSPPSSRLAHGPTFRDWQLAKRITRYLKRTNNVKIRLKNKQDANNSVVELTIKRDEYFSCDKDSRDRSAAEYFV